MKSFNNVLSQKFISNEFCKVNFHTFRKTFRNNSIKDITQGGDGSITVNLVSICLRSFESDISEVDFFKGLGMLEEIKNSSHHKISNNRPIICVKSSSVPIEARRPISI